MIATEQKKQIISNFARKAGDTGSTEVQIALIDARIKELNEHFKTHKKDFHSKTGLLRLVGKRKKLLDYLKRTELERYKKLIETLGLRK
ncbi:MULTISPECIES: 30S ribosomal protein S15 [Leptospira]|uniref:Small ribosomal subunit protein uS15 n=27 Tax=Leptospira TaxID=171 RepID=RS15_LEPIN|nr:MULTISPECIES: 30S ribosomal protein S15 [Leptospira]Q72NX6.1 RecName: Full=Small ribosomal subunit protein uS15; AltName: Full=30S ribosomal protein S15 [Leptospira interrogans serovar Copenhageni str. Fiocruz L1-130]Q8F7J9.2 RecName: Full=Small ribosomal subunit protein uS15; AltName: Full=30S ribosomal protein S15 [Leptospira interrogans serovar Lai str. 56601]APH42493.1 30S ribosomal protein S15 [Leptospira interrogans serovar Copenhageni/Icterohaemorrhagiae]EMF73230.1 ribosomal protein S